MVQSMEGGVDQSMGGGVDQSMGGGVDQSMGGRDGSLGVGGGREREIEHWAGGQSVERQGETREVWCVRKGMKMEERNRG